MLDFNLNKICNLILREKSQNHGFKQRQYFSNARVTWFWMLLRFSRWKSQGSAVASGEKVRRGGTPRFFGTTGSASTSWFKMAEVRWLSKEGKLTGPLSTAYRNMKIAITLQNAKCKLFNKKLQPTISYKQTIIILVIFHFKSLNCGSIPACCHSLYKNKTLLWRLEVDRIINHTWDTWKRKQLMDRNKVQPIHLKP